MQRNLEQLSRDPFDLLVIGGGIQGAALLWLAQRSGLRAALVERDDFGGATSANSQKVIHGGLRYLQALDLPRTLESIRARSLLLQLAPHLVRPMPCLMPLYGHGARGREALAAGLGLYNLLCRGAGAGLDRSRSVPPARLISTRETLAHFPLTATAGLRGGALWYDARCENTERLTLAFVRTAHRIGAVVANRVEAEDPVAGGGTEGRVALRDRLSGARLQVRTRHVARCIGPWLEATRDQERSPLTLGINLVVPPLHPEPISLAVRRREASGGGMFFVVPWRACSIVGTAWLHHHGPAGYPPALGEQALRSLLDPFNAAWPGKALTLADVRQVHAGLVPCRAVATGEPRLLEREALMVRPLAGGGCCIDVRAVKYTTALTVAAKVLRRLAPASPALRPGDGERLIGGGMADGAQFEAGLQRRWADRVPAEALQRLAVDYGSEAEAVLSLGAASDADGQARGALDLEAGMTRFALRHEMAASLADVVLRRSALGSAGLPPEPLLEKISRIMAHELNWDEARRLAEIRFLRNTLPPFLARSGAA